MSRITSSGRVVDFINISLQNVVKFKRLNMNTPWFKNTVVYSLDVKTFLDTDSNGYGDFKGLTKSLGYLKELGVGCLWLRPFYPSPMKNRATDISDFTGIAPELGTMDDFNVFMEKASSLGIRIAIDLILHHTSTEHWWFRKARSDQKSQYKDYYIWTGKEPQGDEKKYWEFDEFANEYYLHRFGKDEPDLNTANPDVRQEIRGIIQFWLSKGVSGFNIDIAHIMADIDPLSSLKTRDYTVLNLINEAAAASGEIMLLTRADDIVSRQTKYLGNRDRMNVLLDSSVTQNILLTIAREEAAPLENHLKRMPIQEEYCQWMNMLQNHDAISLNRLIDEEKQEIFDLFAQDHSMIPDRNYIGRRLAPMFTNNRRRMEMVFSLLFSLPGIPAILYGEEIGMGDDLSLAVKGLRTSMQWNNDINGGFTLSHVGIVQVNQSEENGFRAVNVAKQNKDNGSFLNWIRKLIRIRNKCPEIGLGKFSMIDTDNPDIFIHRISGEENTFIAVHNLSGNDTKLNMNMSLIEGRIIFADISESGVFSEIAPYGYRWLLIPTRSILEKGADERV